MEAGFLDNVIADPLFLYLSGCFAVFGAFSGLLFARWEPPIRHPASTVPGEPRKGR